MAHIILGAVHLVASHALSRPAWSAYQSVALERFVIAADFAELAQGVASC